LPDKNLTFCVQKSAKIIFKSAKLA